MDLEYSTIREFKIYDTVVREQSIETDIVLPEYFPPIGRILKCFVQPAEEAVTVADGRVSVAGTAAVRLLYADDEKKLHCYRTETKYTRVLQSDVHNEKCIVKITQDIVELNYRALGPKRVEIKACAAVKAELCGIDETRVVSAANGGAELLTSEKEYSEAVCAYCRDIIGKENVRCEAADKKLIAVISAEPTSVVEKTEVISNKVMYKGRNDIKLICAAEDGSLGCYDISVPFTEVVDCYGIDEKSLCSTVFTRCDADVELVNESDNVFSASVKNKLFIYASAKKELKVAEDAYMLSGDAECKYSSPVISGEPVTLHEEERVNAETELFEDGVLSVAAAFADGLSFAASRRGKETVIEGSVFFNVLASDSAGQYSLVSKKVPFEHKLPDGMRCVECEVCVRGVCADMAASGRITLSGVIGFEILAAAGGELRVLSDMNARDGGETNVCEHAVIYFAEKGERVWDIAKENRTTVADIQEHNGVGDVIENDTRLIFSNF